MNTGLLFLDARCYSNIYGADIEDLYASCALCFAVPVAADAGTTDGPTPFLFDGKPAATADKTDGPQDQQPQTTDDIIICGSRQGILPGVSPENELNEQDIAAYGADTVGDLLDQVGGAAESSSEGPVNPDQRDNGERRHCRSTRVPNG